MFTHCTRNKDLSNVESTLSIRSIDRATQFFAGPPVFRIEINLQGGLGLLLLGLSARGEHLQRIRVSQVFSAEIRG